MSTHDRHKSTTRILCASAHPLIKQVHCAAHKLRCYFVATLLFAVACGRVSDAQPQNSGIPAGKERAPERYELRLPHLTYMGAFRVPRGNFGVSSFSYGGTAITFNPHRSSLFIVGHDHQQAVSEVEIPEIINSFDLEDLKTAKVLQPFTDLRSKIPNFPLKGDTKIGGLLVVGHELVGTFYEFYDAEGDARVSHFKLSSLDLSRAKATGLFQMGKYGAGYVGGYMGTVPADWQERFGCKCLTGLCGVPIISRTSAGPSLFGFDPAKFGENSSQVVPFVYYPFSQGGRGANDHPLADTTSQNAIYNQTSTVGGVVFPNETNSVLFFGAHGIGQYWYGSNGDYPNLNDTARTDKGTHAYPYVYQVWAYNAQDLLGAKQGAKRPWQVKPFEIWTFDFPFQESVKAIGGVAYDARRAQLYVSQLRADRRDYDINPVIHVFKLSNATQRDHNRSEGASDQ